MNAYTGQIPETERAPDWRLRAACIGVADQMHPDNDEHEIAAAKAICKPCPVARECFWDAVATGDMTHGIRAGLRPQERRAVVKELQRREEAKPTPKPRPGLNARPKVAKCGTRSGYQRHLKQKTEICAPCRQANTDAYNRLVRTGTTKVAA